MQHTQQQVNHFREYREYSYVSVYLNQTITHQSSLYQLVITFKPWVHSMISAGSVGVYVRGYNSLRLGSRPHLRLCCNSRQRRSACHIPALRDPRTHSKSPALRRSCRLPKCELLSLVICNLTCANERKSKIDNTRISICISWVYWHWWCWECQELIEFCGFEGSFIHSFAG